METSPFTPMSAPLTGENSHLSFGNSLPPLPEAPRLGGPGPFVINLSASAAPIDSPDKRIAGGEHAHIYQIQRIEDRRVRYRLRLGPFASEDEAITVLELVRQVYPCALAATADTDDLRAIANIDAKADSRARQPSAVTAALSATVTTAPPTRVKAAAPAAPASRAAPAAVHVPRAVESTQSVRELGPVEIDDAEAARWYSIQLSLSDQPFDPDAVPAIDIFSVYRLYSVAGLDQGRTKHALRLGFFGEEASAAAVASYLRAHYDKPTVKRVSVAERERFADQRLEARKDVGASGKHAAIEITSERYVRDSSRSPSGAHPKTAVAATATAVAATAERPPQRKTR